MAVANLTDMSILATDTTFGNRVLMSLFTFCITTLSGEAISAANLAQHIARKNFASSVLLDLKNNPTNYKALFVTICAANQIVANDATATGTLVGMTPAQVATAAASCTDIDINNAVSAAFNSLIAGI